MRLAGLQVRNFKKIGDHVCKVRIDEIVVLIGPNNSGKSTILDAYEVFASSGKELDISFFNEQNETRPIEITGVFDAILAEDEEVLGKKWKHLDPEFGECIKVRWIWKTPGVKGEKQSFNPEANTFEPGGVGGWDSMIQSRIPQPVRIRPTESVETTQVKVVGLLKTYVKDRLKADSSKTKEVLDQIDKLAAVLFDETKTAFDDVAKRITSNVSGIFPGAKIELVPQSKDAIDEKVVGAESFLKVGTTGGFDSPLLQQGTGIQRALLWSALSVMSDVGDGKKKSKTLGEATRILLIDEPEAFLHPPTIREAREALYKFALDNKDWQVLATTHSPIFIDLGKDHTTIVRVDPRSPIERYISTDKMSFDEDERTRLKMIRATNPIVNEFFFYENIILVEGPTEQIAVQHVAKSLGLEIHVINCLGKANIPLFQRILNQFRVPYTVIHDSDQPKVYRKKKLISAAMWTINESIRQSIDIAAGCRIFVQVPHFEGEFLGETLVSGKVDRVLELISEPESPEYMVWFDTYRRVLTGDHSVFVSTAEAFRTKVDSFKTTNSLELEATWG